MQKLHPMFVCFLLLPSLGVAGHVGSPDLEPQLVGRSDVLLFEDFEASDWYTRGWDNQWPGQPKNTSITSTKYAGRSGLRVHFPKGSHVGSTAVRFYMGNYGIDEAHFRYYIRFGTTWGNGAGGKLPGFARRGPGTTRVCGMDGAYTPGGADGDRCWSARVLNWWIPENARIQLAYYYYHVDQPSNYGSQLTWSRSVNRNEWLCLEGRVKLNTPGMKNGILQSWVNGALTSSKSDIRFRTASTNDIGELWFGHYIGGSQVAPNDMEIFYDNVVVAKSRVNCYGTASPTNPEPSALPAPQDLQVE